MFCPRKLHTVSRSSHIKFQRAFTLSYLVLPGLPEFPIACTSLTKLTMLVRSYFTNRSNLSLCIIGISISTTFWRGVGGDMSVLDACALLVTSAPLLFSSMLARVSTFDWLS